VFELSHSADHGGTSVSIRLDVEAGAKVYDAIMLRSFAGERAIERGPPVGLDLGFEIAADLEVGSWPEL
jgi:hypothetical protein